MLRRLTIRNLAIVEDLDLELSAGLTIVTGETGAGKSILVDAIGLLAGSRGSSELVREGAGKLVVAGEFDANARVRELLAEAGLPDSDPVLLRREVSADGRSRVFVDDEPAAVRTLARLGEHLVAVYGQSSEQDLSESGAPLELLDAFAGSYGERGAVGAAFAAWKAARGDLDALEAAARDRATRIELLDFQIREVEAVAPTEGEEEALTVDRDRLLHADRIRRAGSAALEALSEGEGSAADRLGEAVRAFADLAAIDPRERENLEEAEIVKGRIADLAAAARDAAGQAEADPDRLTSLEDRLDKLSRLRRKLAAGVPEILASLSRWKSERSELADIDDALERRRRSLETARQGYADAAASLSAKRRAAATRFSAAVEKELRVLAMEKARFRVVLEPAAPEAPRPGGLEKAAFLFAPNAGEPEKPLERIASGGELSRLQLAVGSVAARRSRLGRTLVFDEVDAGIGGRTAETVGRKLRDLAAADQVLCVTHVPQIAALADRHYLAEKRESRGRTVAAVRILEGPQRVGEIARMLAGEKVPATAVEHAKELIDAARR